MHGQAPQIYVRSSMIPMQDPSSMMQDPSSMIPAWAGSKLHGPYAGSRFHGPICRGLGPWDPFGGAHRPWRPKADIMEAEGRLNEGLGAEPPGKGCPFGSHLGAAFHPENTFRLRYECSELHYVFSVVALVPLMDTMPTPKLLWSA